MDDQREKLRDRTLDMLDGWAGIGVVGRILVVATIILAAIVLALQLLG